MIKKIAILTSACMVLTATVGCGSTESDKEEQINEISSAAHKMIDDDFVGIISNNADYCYGSEAQDYSKKITSKYDADVQWLIVADEGDIKVYYGDTWKSQAYSAEIHKKNGNPTLAQIYINESNKMETAKKESEEKATEPVTDPPEPTEKPTEKPAKPSSGLKDVGAVKLETGGKQFTVAAWDASDVPALMVAWEDATGYDDAKVNFINLDCGGGGASEKYDNLFMSGDDLDVYFCEADWALRYINDDTRTAPLEDLGFSEKHFADQFAYTQEIGRATSGRNAGKMVGTSWQACGGGFAYRADLAEQYLGVKSPEEMQAKIGGWDDFVAAATTVASQSGGKVALADSVGGIWQAFSSNRTTPWVVDNELWFDGSCNDFANYAKMLWDNGGVTHNAQWSDDWIADGQKGSCMGYFVTTWALGETGFFGRASSNSYGKWAICEGPDSYFWGGTWIVVNPATDNAEEAQSFIYYSTIDRDSMKKYALGKPEYVNNMSVMKEIIDKGENPNEFVTKNFGGQNYFKVLDANVKSVNLKGVITPYDGAMRSSFVEAVVDYYIEGFSWDETLSALAEDVYNQFPNLS